MKISTELKINKKNVSIQRDSICDINVIISRNQMTVSNDKTQILEIW